VLVLKKILHLKNSLKVSIAPIVDNLAVTRKDNDIYVNAIIDSKLLKNETCSNDFENIFTPDFNLTKKTFQELFIHFYSTVPYIVPETQEELNADNVINDLDKTGYWLSEVGLAGYLSSDLNFDGQSNNKDKNDIWLSNINQTCQVP